MKKRKVVTEAEHNEVKRKLRLYSNLLTLFIILFGVVVLLFAFR